MYNINIYKIIKKNMQIIEKLFLLYKKIVRSKIDQKFQKDHKIMQLIFLYMTK